MNNLSKRLNDTEVKFLGNRVRLVLYAIAIGSLASYTITRKEYHLLPFTIALITESASGINENAILRLYRKTRRHIEKNGEISEKFFEKATEKYRQSRLNGYCITQGIYLAAKEKGMTKEFRTLKKKYSKNIVPNF